MHPIFSQSRRKLISHLLTILPTTVDSLCQNMGLCHGPVCWGIGTIVSLVVSLLIIAGCCYVGYILYKRIRQRQREAIARGDLEAGIWIPIPRALYVSPPPRAYRPASPQRRTRTKGAKRNSRRTSVPKKHAKR